MSTSIERALIGVVDVVAQACRVVSGLEKLTRPPRRGAESEDGEPVGEDYEPLSPDGYYGYAEPTFGGACRFGGQTYTQPVETGHDMGLSAASELFPQHTKSSASNHTGTGAEPGPSPTIVQSAPPPTVDGGGPSEVSGHPPVPPSEGLPTSPSPRDDGILAGDRPGSERVPGPGHPDDAAAEWIGEAVPVISEVLAKHWFWPANHSSIGSASHCNCGYRPLTWGEWHEHVAPLIANALAPQDK